MLLFSCCSFVFLSLARIYCFFLFSSRRRHTRSTRDWSSDVCSSDLAGAGLVVLLLVGGGLLAFGGDGDGEPEARPEPKPAALPRGGRTILPDFRVVAYYGAPQDDELGILGIGSPRRAVRRLERQAKPYSRPPR